MSPRSGRMERKSVVASGSTRRFVAMALCWGWLAGCSAGGVPSNAAGSAGEAAQAAQDASALATALPPRVGLSLRDIENARGNLPYCRLYSDYGTPRENAVDTFALALDASG